MKHKEASRLRAGRVEMTGAADENGVLVELSGFDIERLSRDQIDSYNERRAGQIASRRDAAREADDLRRFTEAYIEAGGGRNEAASAFREQRDRQATEAASRAEASVLKDSRRRIRQAL